ncbi:RNA polymerase sigma factor [Henriciella aquimarina]|uniref:RNA polymerase sigma factor n=1 Tax=Henriciella aquimarina TaxID=545261 RepID=UPI0009FBF32B|nr:RNA polymerase sigma factor [Henriciella aquimarina]
MGVNRKQSRAGGGEPIQLDLFARKYGAALRRYFARRGAPAHLCDDLVHDVYLRLAARQGEGEIENAEAFLMQCAANIWRDHWRKTHRRGEASNVEYDDFVHSFERLDPERVLLGKEAFERFVEALDALPSRTRDVYLLCRMDGVRRKEAARRFGMSVSSVDKHLLAATKHMGLALGDRK